MMETFRRSYLTLPLLLAAAADGVATFIATHKARISQAQLALSDSGTGDGATAIRVNVNGVAITGDADLSIAGAAADKAVKTEVILGSNQFPGGALINPGDVVTVDVISVPDTTQPKAGCVVLDLVQVDV